MKKLVILSTQRSGSTMACDDIAGTNMLGRPSEYFIKVIDMAEQATTNELRNLISKAMEKGKSANGITSVKIMSNQIKAIGCALYKAKLFDTDDYEKNFYDFFYDAVFVRIIRRDKIAQAVSRVMAEQSGIFHASDDLHGLEGMLGKVGVKRNEDMLVYQSNSISKALSNINKEECYLDCFLNKFGLRPVEVFYESIVTDRSYVNEIAELLEINDIDIADRRLRKISGDIANDWINRYRMEHNIN